MRDGSGRCKAHQAIERKQFNERRGSANERGYTAAWQRARAGWLRLHPLCKACEQSNRVEAANVVDHIVPHRFKQAMDSGDAERIARAKELFWSKDNWQSLCEPCHNRKTAQEDSGFAQKRRS